MANKKTNKKIHRRHNWKGRQIVNTWIDESKQKQIQLDLIKTNEHYDSCNALVLPSQKRATKKLLDKDAQPVKLLSRKKRKRLEKIVEQKKKKANRAELLAALEQVQVNPKQLNILTQLHHTQTLGRKKFLSDDFTTAAPRKEDQNNFTASGIRGIKRQHPMVSCKRCGLDVVNLADYSDDDTSCEDSDESEDHLSNQPDSAVGALNSLKNEMAKEEEDLKDDRQNGNSVDDNGKVFSASECEKATVASCSGTASDIQNATAVDRKPSNFVAVNRDPAVQEERLKLPILSEEHAVMEAINENPIAVVVGATGSGKTTQVPQFLYEAGYASGGKIIGITEPRRVAAISMSQRVAYEMNLSCHEVSYQIRFEGNTTSHTKIKFMTDGILLKEIQQDPTLKKYSVVIIDEAHERSVFSDILIGILSRIIPRREAKGKPLKMVIMSATLRVEDFTENARLFRGITPPVVKVGSHMYDVTIHFNKHTEDNYVAEAYKKVCKIHRQLPDGGILVFLTGQREVNGLCCKLQDTFPLRNEKEGYSNIKMSAYMRQKVTLKKSKTENCIKMGKTSQDKTVVLPEIRLEDFEAALPDDHHGEDIESVNVKPDSSSSSSMDLVDDLDYFDDDGFGMNATCGGDSEPEQPLWVLPLYSMLPPEKQQLVFQPPPEGTRLCVVATNVAETSVTLPDIKYVVDSGKIKEKVYDGVTGVSMFHVTWTSQASTNQRAGRCGRTAPGHCYRLYSSAVFNDELAKFAPAEIQQRPIDDIVLLMKSMNLPVVNFPFPTPPDYVQIHQSLTRLVTLGALEDGQQLASESCQKKPKVEQDLTRITPLGKAMALFPVAPRYGKMLALSHQHNLLPYTIVIVASLTVQEVLIETSIGAKNANELQKGWQNLRLHWSGKGDSRLLGDLMVLLRAVGAAEHQDSSKVWCEKNGLRHKAVVEVRRLCHQLTNEVNLILPGCNLVLDSNLPPPSENQARMLRQIVLAGTIDHVARKVNEADFKTHEDRQKWKNAYRALSMEEPVFLPSSSVLRIDKPEWVVFQDIYETNKMYMRGVTAIDPKWLARFAPKLCSLSPPLESPPPRYDVETGQVLCHCTATFGSMAWEIPDTEILYPHGRDLFQWVAYFFLMGDICPLLKPFTEHLYEPKTVISPVALRFKEQRTTLLRTLIRFDITGFKKLKEVWQQHPQYLLHAYLKWVKDEAVRPRIISIWPPLLVDQDTEWN